MIGKLPKKGVLKGKAKDIKKCTKLEKALTKTMNEAKKLEELYSKEVVKAVKKPSPKLQKKALKLKTELAKAHKKSDMLKFLLGPMKKEPKADAPKPLYAKRASQKCNKLQEELNLTVKRIKAMEEQFKKECTSPPKAAAKRAKVLKKAIKQAKKQAKVLKKALKPVRIPITLNPQDTIEVVKCMKKIKKLEARIKKLRLILKTGTPEQELRQRRKSSDYSVKLRN